ncbi:hypothetical protein TCA2_4461 [Paenibacillus sp. TCA20]|uniref:Uncharacterized protein n=1 Tax=Paenibacillus urinalis TaxID=521520 RepID=A0ABY7XKZ0_9BACL|nr:MULTISPECIES: hypothetical protein [Paenibacillus]WDI05202.1 hypothetical protein PUW25_25680 [Paenibacillus urinalis]GAK41969.1 hypothetical protein TCA2_4461 [Paenibacillus sp. TCA20]
MPKEQFFNYSSVLEIALSTQSINSNNIQYQEEELKVANVIFNNNSVSDEQLDNISFEGIKRLFEEINYTATLEDGEEYTPNMLRDSIYQHVYMREFIFELKKMQRVRQPVKFF